jgi:Protein kinase domain
MQTTQQLGRYEIVAELGRGAMGAVFRARDPKIDRTVAIKTIAVPGADATSMQKYRQRFFREAQAAGRLSHPGIVTIYDVDEDEPTHTPFIVMEYADGQTLYDFVLQSPGGKLPLPRVLDLIEQIAGALQYAHSAGIVHRDIKPTNIIVTPEGRTKITDFGIAKISLTEATVAGQILGTPAYMSPEQINGKPVDGRSDLFSLGVMAYWLLTGVKPFDGDSMTAICAQVAGKDPQPASEVVPGLGADFDSFLSRALAKDPAQRFQTGNQFIEAVQSLRLGGKPKLITTSSGPAPALKEQTVLVDDAATTKRIAAGLPEAKVTMATLPHGVRATRLAVIYPIAAVFLLLAGAGLFALNFSGSMPATLQVVGQYPFQKAEIYIWVDGELRYHDELRGAVHSHSRLSHSSPEAGGTLALTLPVRAGRHFVRVQVDAPGHIHDHDTAIPGQFRAYSQKTLLVNFSSRNLDLRWE